MTEYSLYRQETEENLPGQPFYSPVRKIGAATNFEKEQQYKSMSKLMILCQQELEHAVTALLQRKVKKSIL